MENKMPNPQNVPVSAKPAVTESFILLLLDIPMRAALEQKFNALAPETRDRIAKDFPTITSNVERYALRQMIREANGRLASQKRPGWFGTIQQWGPSLESLNETTKTQAATELQKLSEQFDAKEAATLLKKYKVARDMTTESGHIKDICLVFGILPASLK
jgi:hypothetical protein